MEFEGRGRQAGPEGFGMPARFFADSPAPGRLDVELRDTSRALALLGDVGSKVTEESLTMMPVLLSLLKHDAVIVVRQSIVNGTQFFCSVLEEIAIQIHQIGKIGRWLEDMWAWMVKFKDAVCGLAMENGSVPVRALAVKFLEVYISLFTSDGNDHEGSFMEDKVRSFNISQLIGVHSIFEPALLSSEMSKCVGLLLDLLQSSSMSPGSLTIVIINCLSAIARKRPVHYSRILSALLAFNPDSQTRDAVHISSIRYSLKTAFIGFLKCIHHPLIVESREMLVRALRTLNPGDTTEQIIRQIDKMTRNAENLSRDARFCKDGKTSSQLPVSSDTISKRSVMQVANDGSSMPDDTLKKRSRYAVSMSRVAAAPSPYSFEQDDDNVDIDVGNGFSHNVSLLDSDMTTVEKMIVMIGALLAQGERGVESLEILISQMQPDLLADIVILNMKHLPKSPLPLLRRLGSYVSQISSSDSSLQTGTPMAVVPATETADISLSSSPSAPVISTSITDMSPFPSHLAEAKRDPRRDPRRLDPRRTLSTGAQPMALNLENGNDLHSVLDDSLGRPLPITIETKVASSLVPLTVANESVISESSQSVDVSTLQECPVLLDHEPLKKGPFLAVEVTSDVSMSPVQVDQDLEPMTTSETTGNNGVDFLVSESDLHSSSVTSASITEEEYRELPSLPLFIELTDDQKRRFSSLAVSHIAESYKQKRADFAYPRLCLLARLVSQADADVDIAEMLQKYIAKDYHHHKGHELAMYVLYQLHSVMIFGAEEQSYSSATCTYERFLLALAKSLCNVLPASDKSFSRLLNEAPLLPESALNLLDDLCHSPGYKQDGKDAREGDRVTQGLGAVWSLILARPCTRQACLKIALRCAVDSQDEVRGKAIRLVANKLYPLSYVTENIEHFAKTMILSLVDEQIPDKEVALGTSDVQRSEDECQEASTSDSQLLGPSPVERVSTKVAESGPQSGSPVSFSKAQQHSSLFFALCTKRPKLLQFIFDIYGRAPKAVKQSINWHAPDLVRKLGSSCPELLNIISNYPEGSENILMLVLQVMTEEIPPSAELIATVKKLHQTKYKDAAIIIPILSSLSKEEVLPIFPRLVDLPMEKFQTALARILQGSAHTGPALTPTEVLVAIHDINPERDGVALKKIMEVCSTCFEQKTVFTQHVFVRALNELIERTNLPLLFMRTVIQAVDAFPSLIDFVMEILSKLVTKQVWRMPKLWPGFLKCASQTKPHSFPVLLQLPTTILENVLQKHAILKAPLAAYANQAHVRSSLPRQVLEVLGSGNEQNQPLR